MSLSRKKPRARGIGKNALIVSILTKYDEWDSVVEDLGYSSIPSEMIGRLIESLDKDSIFFDSQTGFEERCFIFGCFGMAHLTWKVYSNTWKRVSNTVERA